MSYDTVALALSLVWVWMELPFLLELTTAVTCNIISFCVFDYVVN